jgi:hypothetical protein
MTRIIKSASCIVGALVLLFAARDAGAVQLTLNLVQPESFLTMSGDFSTLPFLAQEGVAGTVDLDPLRPSVQTTFQGTITVEVDSVMSPSSIRILSSVADADVGGRWLPEVQQYLDLDMDGSFGEFGDDSEPTLGDDPAPGMDADWGVRVFHPAFGANIAWAAARDIVYNVTSATETVDALGAFSSLTQNFEFSSGWLDYWVAPAAGNLRGRAEFAGDDEDNIHQLPSTYIVTPLPGNKKEIRLFIPIDVDAPGDDANFFYDGQFVATLVIPEPSAIILVSMGMALIGAVARRGRA